MSKKAIFFLTLSLVLIGSVKSAQIELDSDLMQTIEDTNKSLSSNIAIGDIKLGTTDAKELIDLFSKVEVYFVQKGDAPDAVDLTKKSKELAVEITQSLGKKDLASAMDQATTLSRTCKTCHNFYKKS